MRIRKSLLWVWLTAVAPLSAQTVDAESGDPSYKRVYVLDVGLGFGMPDVCGNGSSSWVVPKDKDNSGFVSSMQLMTFSARSAIGYGAYYYHYKGAKKKYDNMDEALSFHYAAPQVSFLKRQTAFENGVGYVNAGLGYARYQSKGNLMQQTGYRTSVSGIGCNVGLAYEYIFSDANMGIRVAVDCVYARLKGLHKDKAGYPAGWSVRPREKSHLLVPSLGLGLSYYMFRR